MGKTKEIISNLFTDFIGSFLTFITVAKKFTYSEAFDFTDDNPRDIPDIGKVAAMIADVGSGLRTIEYFAADLTLIEAPFYSAPIPTITDTESIIALLRVFPDQTIPSVYYFKVPEIDGTDLINIEWDGVSDIKILIKIG